MANRLRVLKTYKLYIGGKFPRTESGRTLKVRDSDGELVAHVCKASRKDLRDAVGAAQAAQPGWAARTAYNRGQVLYRMAEMLEGKAAEFSGLLGATTGSGKKSAVEEVERAIERLVCFAGWSDKYTQVLGGHNPVAGPFYNFTIPEPTGVIGIIAPDEQPLLGLISLLAPVLCSGNAVVALGSDESPLATAVLGEVCATSDVPSGVVNLLSGERQELVEVLARHRDVQGIHAAGMGTEARATLEAGAGENMKRVTVRNLSGKDWYDDSECHSPYWIEPFVEYKTIWHPSAP
ncbi:MAG: aldehyde dehydrogenase family protein [Xanthomonadales bacterium]|nr:aldehyde dehydrogenase family protein [Xanthomonadales bacterium]